jgi:CheY-like chemotaxis protein/HPt (histidine-containing phosphotransfer) domain-containing protein
LQILLAEDHPVNQKLAVRMLTKHGHRVVVASSGKEVLHVLERQGFDLVLMDVQMPEMSGFEATAAIRAKEQSAGGHLPIIAMTAHAMKGDRERCLEAGMDGYISKPIRAEELFAAIAALATAPAPVPSETSDTSPSVVFDLAEALRSVDGDEDFLRELVELFSADCPRLMAEIEAAVAMNDRVGLRRAAHTLKGSAWSLGAAAVAEVAVRLETMGSAGELASAEAACHQLRRELVRLEAAWVPLREGEPVCR